MKTNQIILPSLVLVLCLAAGALTLALIQTRRSLARANRVLDSIPLRSDQRKQSVGKTEAEMHHVSFYDDSTLLFTSGNTIYLQPLKGRRPGMAFMGHSQSIQDYEVSPNGKRIATASEDGTLRLWDPGTGDCLALSQQLDTLDQPGWTMLHDIVYSTDGKRILTADMTGIKTWRASDLQLLSSEESDVFYLCNGLLSPRGDTFCSRSPGNLCAVEIYGRRAYSGCYSTLAYLEGREPLSYSADGRRLLVAVTQTGDLEIWDIDPRTMRETRSILWMNTPDCELSCAAFSRDGSQVVSAHVDGTVRVWNAYNGAEREILHWEGRPIDGVCFSPGGDEVLAYSSSTGEYCLWGPFQWML